MGANLGALLHHHYGNIRAHLFETDGSREPGRARANNNHVKFHRLAGGQLGHEPLPSQLSTFRHGAAIAQCSC